MWHCAEQNRGKLQVVGEIQKRSESKSDGRIGTSY